MLQGGGVFIHDRTGTPVALQFEDGVYVERGDDQPESFGRDELIDPAAEGRIVGTFTGLAPADRDAVGGTDFPDAMQGFAAGCPPRTEAVTMVPP